VDATSLTFRSTIYSWQPQDIYATMKKMFHIYAGGWKGSNNAKESRADASTVNQFRAKIPVHLVHFVCFVKNISFRTNFKIREHWYNKHFNEPYVSANSISTIKLYFRLLQLIFHKDFELQNSHFNNNLTNFYQNFDCKWCS
jgi:hypothetical protein